MDRVISHSSFPFPPKQDKTRTFSPIVLFHEHTYKKNDKANSVECIRISSDDEHQGEFVENWRKRVDNMLREHSLDWIIVMRNSREYEYERRFYGREMCHRPVMSSPPIHLTNLSNSIYSHHQTHPQDQIETMKPKRRRGNLPKATTALLKDWLAVHRKHPYPTEEEKLHLARDTNLSLQQISNWFINARRRHLPHLLESDYVSGKVSGNSQNSELDIFPYEASDNSTEDSDNNVLLRRHTLKCSTRVSKNRPKPYTRKRKTSSV